MRQELTLDLNKVDITVDLNGGPLSLRANKHPVARLRITSDTLYIKLLRPIGPAEEILKLVAHERDQIDGVILAFKPSEEVPQ